MNRREFLGAAAGLAALGASAESGPVPIIDTHIHLFDPRRPQGVPWPVKNDAILYRPALPERYRSVTQGLGVVGAMEVEASPWLEDNQWVLDVAARDSIIVGTVGDLAAGKPDFRRHLERFHRNPLFRGIRCGNLWGRSLAADVANAAFIADLKALGDAGLALDTANQDPALIRAALRVTDKVPNLRVVIDHLPHLDPPADAAARAQLESDLRELATRPNVYVKVSEVLRRSGGQVRYDVPFYRARLDELWGTFGEDKLMYGSDWPNSDPWGSYPQVLHLVQEYLNGKSRMAREKFFWRNSLAAYRWVKRAANQPGGSDQ
jgi:predicted TIM-barrel fold metal-dependent hydrolase